MKQFIKNLGKVSITPEGIWNHEIEYEKLSIVYDKINKHAYLSKTDVPALVDITDTNYWMPLNVSGYAENNTIILNKIIDDKIESYNIESAIKNITQVGRRPGIILIFYNENSDRLDIGGCWEIWQFNSVNVDEWEDVTKWVNVYYNYNKFVGWYNNVNGLKAEQPFPQIGCYAYVGVELNNAIVYRCDVLYQWTKTLETAKDYIKLIIDGIITIGENGNWIQNGNDTGIPASIKGDDGKTPYLRNNNNIIEYSYDEENWLPISDKIAAYFRWNIGDVNKNHIGNIQISRDGVSWNDLSGNIVTGIHIAKYIEEGESLPETEAEGTVYAKGPTYTSDDIDLERPLYTLYVYTNKDNILQWVNFGIFNGISVGVSQTLGHDSNLVISQKAISDLLSFSDYPTFTEDITYPVGYIIRYNNMLYQFIVEHDKGAWDNLQVIPVTYKPVVYLSEAQYHLLETANRIQNNVEYNIYEDE